MDYIKEVEKYLGNYYDLKRSIKHADYMINKLKWKSCPQNLKSSNYDITGISVKSVNNTSDEMHQLILWQDIRETNLKAIEHIEKILEAIDKENECLQYKKVLEMWYIKKMDKVDIALELGYESRKSAYQIRNKALKKFAVSLFGVYIFKAM